MNGGAEHELERGLFEHAMNARESNEHTRERQMRSPRVAAADLRRVEARIEAAEEAPHTRKSSAPGRDFVASILEAIDALSSSKYPDLRMTADFVSMSIRTLQRRLAAAGTTHDVLVAQARFATAAAVLESTDAKILDLALDLGYSDHANFTRAFRRWAGCSPREYRLRHTRRRHVANALAADLRGDVGPRTTIARMRAPAEPDAV